MKIRIFTKIRIFLLGLVLLVVTGLVFFLLRSDTLPGDIRQILLISIDTCRADHLSCYGYFRKTTPNIDEIAQEGFIFRNAITPVPLTLPSHSSMLTGTIPSYHGVHDNEGYKLDESNITLAEILRENGFRTGAIISAFVMDSQFGLDQGFESYNDKFEEEIANNLIVQRRGGEVSRFAVDWLDEHKDEKFFLFLHYYDPHSRYEPPEPFASLYKEDLYAGEVAYADYCIGQVINKLKELGLYDSALIIITSDHGEMLGEHNEFTHGYYIYQSAIKVPLIIKLPGQKKSLWIERLAGLIDIVPSICNMLGVKVPQGVQGKDMSVYFHDRRPSSYERYLYCESLYPTRYKANSILGVVTERRKYIQTTRPELYDLLNDPEEAHNLMEQQAQQALMLRDSLRQILEQTLGKSEFDSKMELDEESRKRLESLGYVSGTGLSEDFDFDQSKDEPKDLIDFHLDHGRLNMLFLEKKYDEARQLCEKLLYQRPGLSRLHIRMGEIAVEQNDYTMAVSHFSKAVTLEPQGAAAHRSLATALALQDKMDEAVEHYEKSLQIQPEQPVVLDNLARIYSRQGKVTEA
ncbi:MAG: sulfatase, partial [Planctomycetota bacterium]